uniref:Uncharacterized protein n=1 Tax=Trichuris muris TaxID=70415 RepID=A0A5S6QP15_TRIMR
MEVLQRSMHEELSLRTDTWFQGHRLDFRTAAMFIYCWNHGYTTPEFCSNEHSMIVRQPPLNEVYYTKTTRSFREQPCPVISG